MGKKRKLSEADEEIWNEVRKSVSPLHLKTKSLKSNPLQSTRKPVEAQKPTFEIEAFSIGSKSATKQIDQKPDRPTQTSPHMDKRNFQRLIKGKKEIDLKIDLHGMTFDQARRHLQSRLIEAQSNGMRLVLVVTGKGNKTRTDEFNRPQSGILRQNLPKWCGEFPLSKIVLQVAQAQQKHGGSGAYYVYLRRAR